MNLTKEELELENLLNNLFKVKNVEYDEFNSLITFKEKIPELRKLEKMNNNLVVARGDTELEGISTISIIATITRILCKNKVLSFVIDNINGKTYITGVRFLTTNKEI